MLYWSVILFGLGVLAFLDAQLNQGNIFRAASPTILMLSSIGILVRSKYMAKLQVRKLRQQKLEKLTAQMLGMKNCVEPYEHEKPMEKSTVSSAERGKVL